MLRQRLERGGFQWVKRLATLGETERARALDLKEILHFETESKRYYPYGTVAAHVLGTVGLDHYGQAGLEQEFEARLRGRPGIGVLQYDARQRRYGTQTLRGRRFPATTSSSTSIWTSSRWPTWSSSARSGNRSRGPAPWS